MDKSTVINIKFKQGNRERISCYYRYDSGLLLQLTDVDIEETERIQIHAALSVEEKAVNLEMVGEYLFKVDDALLRSGKSILIYVVVVGPDYLATTQEAVLDLGGRAGLPQ